MSEYNDFPKDFIVRTLKNIDDYAGNLEITNLINNCLGLIIIPKQKLNSNIPIYKFNEKDSEFGITKNNILLEHRDDYSLANILRHIRNGLAHGRIEQKSKEKVIVGLRIHDRFDESSPENFVIDFTIKEFQEFAKAVSKMFLNRSTESIES